MSNPQERLPLRQEGSDLSDASTAIGTPSFPYQRQGYHRMASQSSIDFDSQDLNGSRGNPLITANVDYGSELPAQGLGISGRQISFQRVPVGSRASLSPPTPSKPTFTPNMSSNPSPMTPGSSKPMFSPQFQQQSGSYSFDGGGQGLNMLREEDDISDISRRKAVTIDEHAMRNNDNGERISMHNDNDHTHLVGGCPSRQDIHNSRASWLSISILMLSIYSTIFSGIWLILALVQPRYGRTVHSGGKLTPTTASTLFALFAKTIELSFVTVFVTFLGQVLTRRSLVKASRGVTIAELSMRTWVIQPGFMITHWQHLQHAALSVLGVITLTAAVVAMFYTTASDSLVSPHLKYGRSEEKMMFGLVKASYANPKYIEKTCQTPISINVDPVYAGTTCLSVEHAGQAYHNSMAYLSTWQSISLGGIGTSANLADRPRPPAMLFDNTTVIGSWVQTNSSNMTSAYEKYKRVVNNVTMSMPHAGVLAAAQDRKNDILQPEELAGVGEYYLRASVVSPTVNILCANMNQTELEPLIYADWPGALTNKSTTVPGQKLAWPGYQLDVSHEFQKKPFLNSTVVDDIFEWGPTYGLSGAGHQPPVFPMRPMDFNSILNITVAMSDSNYMLIKSAATPDYTMCQIRGWTSPNCSTQYNVSGTTGGHLESHCEERNDKMAYNRSVQDAPAATHANDYRNVASEWLLALSLNTGVSNANSSTSRLLSQLVPTYDVSWQKVQLKSLQPSLAETLAVMAGSTLLKSSIDSTFYHYWDYENNILDPGNYQPFNASLASQQYTSGYLAKWQIMFYLVLLLVFVTNVFCLVYFFLRSGLVTDYTEPQNLFALAVNSPPSRRLSGSCGAGPKGDDLNVNWHVAHEENSNHFFIKEGSRGEDMEMRHRRGEQRSLTSISSYNKLSSKRKSWL